MNRIISFLHCFGIVSIVIWHAQAINGSIVLMDWIYTFCLPILFFSSGYLFNEKNFWKKKTRRILFPYFLLSTIIYFPKVLLSQFAIRPVEFSWESYIYQLIINPVDNVNITLWFLPALFIVMLIFIILRKLYHLFNCEKLHFPLFIIYCIFATIFYVSTIENDLFYSRIVLYSTVFIAGHEFKKRHLLESAFSYDKLLAFICFTFTLLVIILPNNNINWLYFVFMIFGTCMSIAFASLYERYKLKILDHLYEKNMTIYIYHWFVQAFIIAIYRRLGEPNDIIYIFLFQSAAIIGGIYIPFLLHKLFVNHKDIFVIKCLRVISGMK